MKNNGCLGCTLKGKCPYTEFSDDCPCILCVIKMMCQKTCSDFRDFSRRVVSIQIGRRNNE
jgi:hypothetical protein